MKRDETLQTQNPDQVSKSVFGQGLGDLTGAVYVELGRGSGLATLRVGRFSGAHQGKITHQRIRSPARENHPDDRHHHGNAADDHRDHVATAAMLVLLVACRLGRRGRQLISAEMLVSKGAHPTGFRSERGT